MKTTARRLPLTPLALAAAFLTAFLVLLAPLSASAHDSLLASSPEADGTVETLPTELTLTFSAKIIDGDGATEVVVTDPSGASVTDGAAAVDGAIVTQPLTGQGPAGQYHVIWKVVSSDGHPTSGEFDFAVSTATDAVATAAPTPAPDTAEPTAAATAAPDAGITQAPQDDESASASVWIWVISIAVILVIIAIVVWLTIGGRRGLAETDSDDPSER